MRSLIIVLLALTVGTTACSKKGSSSVATPPPVVTPDPGPTPESVDNYGIASDNIKTTMTGGYVDFSDYNPQARVAYFQLLHSAMGYGATLLSRYGVSNGYPYATGLTCNNNYLDALYFDFNFYPGPNQLNFGDCFDYTDYIDALSVESAYVEMKLVSGDTVEGNIHATVETSPNTYLTQIMIPFRGKISKVVLPGSKYYFQIAIGSKLLIYTNDNTTKPADRSLTLDFGNDEIGQVNLH